MLRLYTMQGQAKYFLPENHSLVLCANNLGTVINDYILHENIAHRQVWGEISEPGKSSYGLTMRLIQSAVIGMQDVAFIARIPKRNASRTTDYQVFIAEEQREHAHFGFAAIMQGIARKAYKNSIGLFHAIQPCQMYPRMSTTRNSTTDTIARIKERAHILLNIVDTHVNGYMKAYANMPCPGGKCYFMIDHKI